MGRCHALRQLADEFARSVEPAPPRALDSIGFAV